MKKQWIMALALLLCLCVLTACQTSEPERFTVKTADTSGSQAQQTQSSGAYVEDGVTYDPLAEEDDYTADLDYLEGEIATAVPVVTTPAPTEIPPKNPTSRNTREPVEVTAAYSSSLAKSQVYALESAAVIKPLKTSTR